MVVNALGTAARGVGRAVAHEGGAWRTLLHSNEAANPLQGAMRGGGLRAGKGAHTKVGGVETGGWLSGIPRAIQNYRFGGEGVGGSIGGALKSAHTTADGSLAWGSIAGSYMTAAAGYRIASGGGVTRDRHGNPNLIGVPFV